MSADQWTTTPPTVPGWYWAYDTGPNSEDLNPFLQVVHVDYVDDKLVFDAIGLFDSHEALDWFTHWLGPLPEPEPPSVTP